MEFKSAIILPDCHITPGQNLRRFKALGNLVEHQKPEYFVALGDLNEFSGLYGISGKKTWAFKDKDYANILAEIEAAKTAHDLLKTPYMDYVKKAKKNRKKYLS